MEGLGGVGGGAGWRESFQWMERLGLGETPVITLTAFENQLSSCLMGMAQGWLVSRQGLKSCLPSDLLFPLYCVVYIRRFPLRICMDGW